MQPAAVLFDLGNTLVAYYRKQDFAPILQQCVDSVLKELQRAGVSVPTAEQAFAVALQENREATDLRCSPLWPRLVRIFGLREAQHAESVDKLCRLFMQPIFATAHRYHDTIPVLKQLQAAQIKTAIVSNAPWGSASTLWHEELHRLGLAALVNAIVLCGDVGWRKPAPQIFRHVANRLDVKCEDCVFVGDDIEWDMQGSQAVGMRPILLDRANLHSHYQGERICELTALLARVTSK